MMLTLTTMPKIHMHKLLISVKMHLPIILNIRLLVTKQEYLRKVIGRDKIAKTNNTRVRILNQGSRGPSQEARIIPTSYRVIVKQLVRILANFSHQIWTRTKWKSSTIIKRFQTIKQKKSETLGKPNSNNWIESGIQMEHKQEINRIGNSLSILWLLANIYSNSAILIKTTMAKFKLWNLLQVMEPIPIMTRARLLHRHRRQIVNNPARSWEQLANSSRISTLIKEINSILIRFPSLRKALSWRLILINIGFLMIQVNLRYR